MTTFRMQRLITVSILCEYIPSQGLKADLGDIFLVSLCVKERPRERGCGKMIVGISLPGLCVYWVTMEHCLCVV